MFYLWTHHGEEFKVDDVFLVRLFLVWNEVEEASIAAGFCSVCGKNYAEEFKVEDVFPPEIFRSVHFWCGPGFRTRWPLGLKLRMVRNVVRMDWEFGDC